MKNILITDTDVPSIFFLATGRKYTKNELCINDLRRFFKWLFCIVLAKV